MGKIMIINGSPRAQKSNSMKYAELFKKCSRVATEYYAITKKNHLELCNKINGFTDVLFVIPLYVDSIPVTFLNFLKTLENNPPKNKPKISVLINCGFIEPEQNDVAIEMIRFFCKSNGYTFSSVLSIGSGEAILTTPFKAFVFWKIKKLSNAIVKNKKVQLSVTMPLTKKLFIKASTRYWENYGRRNGVTRQQMSTMDIEM